jgi:hypothetical protein
MPHFLQRATPGATSALRRAAALVATAASALLLCTAPSWAGVIATQGTWMATLQGRDINGDGTVDAFYDTVLNITWLADANAAASSIYSSAIDATATDGRMNWTDANTWANTLNVHGTTGWRLPTMHTDSPANCGKFDFVESFGGTDCDYNVRTISADGSMVYSEMAHLYYSTLGNQAVCDTTGDCSAYNTGIWPEFMLTNSGGFINLRPDYYWLNVPYAPEANRAMSFYLPFGRQFSNWDYSTDFALAVHAGDIGAPSAAPEPHALALTLLALAAATAARRSRPL